MQKQIALIGVPIDLGADSLGVNMGPQALRYAGIVKKLTHAGLIVDDLGDITCRTRSQLKVGNPKLKYLSEIERVITDTASKVDQQIKKGKKVVAIGGDHSFAIGSVSGASVAFKGELGLIYIDAHGDFNTDKTTISGNIHGMSLSSLLGFGAKELVDVYKKGVKIKKNNALLVGTSALDPKEEDLIKKENINRYDMSDILAHGLGGLFEKILTLSSRVENIWISLDLDAIDRLYASGVGIPNIGGFFYREIVAIAKFISKKCNVVGMDIVEYNPMQDDRYKTADLAIELIARLLGCEYSSYTEYMEKQK